MKDSAFAKFAGDEGEKVMVMQYLRDSKTGKKAAKREIEAGRDPVSGIALTAVTAFGFAALCSMTVPGAIVGGVLMLASEGGRFLDKMDAKERAYPAVKENAKFYEFIKWNAKKDALKK